MTSQDEIKIGDISNTPLPQWQKNLIDKTLLEIAGSPERLRPIEELFKELDNDD